ncbi:hypothetical protein HC891_17010 [Candidatus Gracilibacteria bacterium]|nr:hypothetical protein [Candidatus Gracilibacteria bacterium]
MPDNIGIIFALAVEELFHRRRLRQRLNTLIRAERTHNGRRHQEERLKENYSKQERNDRQKADVGPYMGSDRDAAFEQTQGDQAAEPNGCGPAFCSCGRLSVARTRCRAGSLISGDSGLGYFFAQVHSAIPERVTPTWPNSIELSYGTVAALK